jgi:adenine-specific DNA-methyltransferase
MDLFYFFFHLALDLTSSTGTAALITTNYYGTATGATSLRSDLKVRSVVRSMVNFNEVHIFESALGQHNMITVLQKGSNPELEAKTCITRRRGFADAELLKAIVSRTDPETEYFSVPQKLLYESDANYICLSGKSSSSSQAPVHRLLAKMQVAPHTLGQLFSVNQGIVTAADKISPKHLKKYALNANTGDGIFVLSDEEIDALRLTEADISILKPWFKNSDVHRWVTSVATDQKVIFADKRLGNLANAKVLMRHLQRFRAVLDDCSSNSPYIHRPRSIDFEGPKLVVPQRAMSNVFAYSSEPWYASADVYFITDPKANSDRLKSILSLLNSKLYFVWFYHKGKRKGEMLELYQTPLSEAPIPLIDKTVQKSLVAIVNRILAAKRKDIDADVTKPEREIDLLVYELYKLTPAEIELVEKAASPRSRRLEAITEEVR